MTYFLSRYIPLIASRNDLHSLVGAIVVLFSEWRTLLHFREAERMDGIGRRGTIIDKFTFCLREEASQHNQQHHLVVGWPKQGPLTNVQLFCFRRSMRLLQKLE